MFDLFAGALGGEEVQKQSSGARLLKVMTGTKKKETRAHTMEALKVARVARRQKRQEEDKQEDGEELNKERKERKVENGEAPLQTEEDEGFDAEKLAKWLMRDLRLRTDLHVCAVCGERKCAFELTSEVIEAKEIPECVTLDAKGVLSEAPLGRGQYRQLHACDKCLVNGCIYWKHALWNANGLGVLEDSYWLSEEKLVATVSCSMTVRYAGSGGYSYKQESQGGASFMYHNVLASLAALLQEEELLTEEMICMVFIRAGVRVLTEGKMLVRVRKLLELFTTLWTRNDLYRRHCLDCANGSWTEERVQTELLSKMQKRLNQPNQEQAERARSKTIHHWPWVPDPTWTDLKTFYVQIGSGVDVFGYEAEVFMQAMPTLFSAVDSERLAQLKMAMKWTERIALGAFAKHVAMLHDNRLGKHDRALFVLNWLVVRARVSAAMFKGSYALDVADGIDNVDAFVQELEGDITADIQQARDKANAGTPSNENNRGGGHKDSLVRKAIDGLKILARGVLGHPMGRSGYRKELKAYHRMLNPGSIWLTINISDKDNVVLRRMYGEGQDNVSEHQRVKSGGISQALFFDAYVQSFLDNVLMVGACGVFGAVEWAGGTVEWCVEGRPHLHLIVCAAKTTPEAVAKAMMNDEKKRKLEQWVADTFCESLDHGHNVSVVMRKKMEDGSLVHVHGAVCKKYQTADDNGKVRCRFEYARQTHQCGNGLKAELLVDDGVAGAGGWQWKLQRDHGHALCHSDKLFEVHAACKDLGDVAHYAQFFGSSGGDGQRVISYCTNYTTKVGVSRIKMKQLLLDIAHEAKAKAALAGDAWGKRDRIIWILRCALVQLMQAVAVPQAQAALNLLELREFYIVSSNPNGYKVVPLYSTPFVEFAAGKDDVSLDVKDYLYRGAELAACSVLQLKSEGWRKEEKDADSEKQGVMFLSGHPQHETHWLVRKKQFVSMRLRLPKREVLVHVLRRQFVVESEDLREMWAKVLTVPFRKQSDLTESWKAVAAENSENKFFVFMQHLLRLECLNSACERAKKNAAENVEENGDELDGDEQNDWRKRDSVARSKNSCSDVEMVAVGVGGEYGQKAVVAARIAGILEPQRGEEESQPQQSPIQDDDDSLILSTETWKRMRENYRNEDDDDEVESRPQKKRVKCFSEKEMDDMIDSWKKQSKGLERCNLEHLQAVLVCVMYLADILVGKQNVKPFSLVVQGAGGTGKTASIIGAVKEFVEYVAHESGDSSILDVVMVLAPTNLAALAIGGQTLDKGIFNRRGKQNLFQGHGVVKLLLIDEFSMISCNWIALIEEALRGKKSAANEANLFGGISIVWLGDVHQLPPVFGHAVYSVSKKMHNGDYQGQKLWRGENWKERKSLAVLVTQQYRMVEPLCGIAQRFANGQQTVEDALLIRSRLARRGMNGKTEGDWLLQFAQNRAKLLTGENNVKAAINWEIVKEIRKGKLWLEWRSLDANGLRNNEEEKMSVVDQLEPLQCVWKWMPVICLENIDGESNVCNGALCWVVHVIGDPEKDFANCELVVVAAKDEEDAQERAKTAKNLVTLKQVVREGRRAFPICPVWAMTLHKVQGATLDRAIIVLGRRLCAHSVYMALSRVRNLDHLWVLEDLPTSLFLALRFDKSVHAEVLRLENLRNMTCDFLKSRKNDWKSLSQLIVNIATAQEQHKDVRILENKTESAGLFGESKEWKIGKTDVKHTIDWLGEKVNLSQRMFPTTSLMLRCSALLRIDVTKASNKNLKWANQEILTKFNQDQQLHLWRVWQMQNVWANQNKTWTTQSELGKLEFKTRSGVMKKEKENDWKQKFRKETCAKTMEKIKKK